MRFAAMALLWAVAAFPSSLAGTAAAETASDWGPVERMRGVWIGFFEGSIFIEGATTMAEARGRTAKQDVWLDRATPLKDDPLFVYDRLSYDPHAVLIEFVGRRSLPLPAGRHPLDGFGHMGLFRKAVRVERLIGHEDLGKILTISSDNPH